MREVGALLGLDGLAADADGQCGITVDATITVHLLHDPQAEAVALFAVVGTLPADRRAVVLELLLAANLFWRGTGGGTLGLDQTDDAIVLAERLALRGLHPSSVIERVRAMADRALAWRSALGEVGEHPAAAVTRLVGRAPALIWG